MKQQSLGVNGLEKYRKQTRKEIFLGQMDEMLPWAELCKIIEPFYPKASAKGGSPAIGLERMLRIHFLQHWFELSDPGAEEARYDSRAMRQFVGIGLGNEPAPDESTICKFRHLMEKHNLGSQLFHLVDIYLEESGLKLNHGAIVDATIIDAPRSTKNKARQRDPDIESAHKGNQWYFGMKAHIGVESRTPLRRYKTSIWLSQSALQRAIEKYSSVFYQVRAGECMRRQKAFNCGLISELRL